MLRRVHVDCFSLACRFCGHPAASAAFLRMLSCRRPS